MNQNLLEHVLKLHLPILKAHQKLLQNECFKGTTEKHTQIPNLISFYLGDTFYAINVAEEQIYGEIQKQIPLTDDILNAIITKHTQMNLRISFPLKYDSIGDKIYMEVRTHLYPSSGKNIVRHDQLISSCDVTVIRENLTAKKVIDTIQYVWFENVDSFRNIDIDRINRMSENINVGIIKPKIKRCLNQ